MSANCVVARMNCASCSSRGALRSVRRRGACDVTADARTAAYYNDCTATFRHLCEYFIGRSAEERMPVVNLPALRDAGCIVWGAGNLKHNLFHRFTLPASPSPLLTRPYRYVPALDYKSVSASLNQLGCQCNAWLLAAEVLQAARGASRCNMIIIFCEAPTMLAIGAVCGQLLGVTPTFATSCY
jgi:hypothetical protein